MPDTKLPDRVRMPLLDLITQQSLDEDYQHVAERRAAAGDGDPRVRSAERRMSLVAVCVFGLLVATAFAQTSRNATTAESTKAQLIERVQAARDGVAALRTRATDLRNENQRLQAEYDVVAADERAAAARLLRLQVSTGYVEVHGPGIRAVVDDGPEPGDRVLDDDLAVFVDALWGAGAEAIAINNRRVTTLTAIRVSGEIIHVGTAPVSPPYNIVAIGDPNTLQANLGDSFHGRVWFRIKDDHHFGWEIADVKDPMTVPAASEPLIRHAALADVPPSEEPESEKTAPQEVAP